MKYLLLILAAVLAENFVFIRGFGADTVLFSASDRSLKWRTLIHTSVCTLVSVPFAILLDRYVLTVFDLPYVKYFLVLICCAALTQLYKMFLRSKKVQMQEKTAAYLLFGAVNSTAIGVLVVIEATEMSLMTSLLYALAGCVGVWLVTVLMSLVYERILLAEVPHSFRGLPILLIVAALLALIFYGFTPVHVLF